MNNEVRDGLYHANLGNLPFHLLNLSGSFELEFGPHARAAAIHDKFAMLTQAPLRRGFTAAEVFEAKVEQGEVIKFCVRIQTGYSYRPTQPKYAADMDLILVLTPSRRNPGKTLFVKTLWFNERTDSHTTLDASKYIAP